MSGTPCFRGTRVPFQNLIDYLEGGHPLVVTALPKHKHLHQLGSRHSSDFSSSPE